MGAALFVVRTLSRGVSQIRAYMKAGLPKAVAPSQAGYSYLILVGIDLTVGGYSSA